MTERETIQERLARQGVGRREFLKLSSALAAFLSLPVHDGIQALGVESITPKPSLVRKVRHALETKPRVPVIWLEFQDCAGCTESISRSLSPTLTDLVLNTLDIEYQETLMAAAGSQAEAAKQAAMKKYAGQYLLVVEGSITTKDGGVYCTVAGKANDALLREAADGAAAIIAVGNCAAFGGILLPRRHRPPGWGSIRLSPTSRSSTCPAAPESRRCTPTRSCTTWSSARCPSWMS
ncbi:MAG: hypothetical protein P8X64_12550 [Anaerolineales bacterium]